MTWLIDISFNSLTRCVEEQRKREREDERRRKEEQKEEERKRREREREEKELLKKKEREEKGESHVKINTATYFNMQLANSFIRSQYEFTGLC